MLSTATCLIEVVRLLLQFQIFAIQIHAKTMETAPTYRQLWNTFVSVQLGSVDSTVSCSLLVRFVLFSFGDALVKIGYTITSFWFSKLVVCFSKVGQSERASSQDMYAADQTNRWKRKCWQKSLYLASHQSSEYLNVFKNALFH